MLAVMFTLACNTGSLPDRPAGVRTSPVVTAQAKCDDLVDGPASKCTLSFSDVAITVSGTGDLVATAGTAVTRAKVPFDEGNLDNVVYYTSYQGDLLLLFDVSNGETGWGGVARLRGPDFNAVWHVKIPAFNIGPATLEGPSLYVSGIGFIARVDVDRGRYVWQHEGLYDRRDQAFNSFDAPVVTPAEVFFLKVIRVQKEGGTFSIEN